MAAKRTGIAAHRPYPGSTEQLTGQPAADDQKFTAVEFMAMIDATDSNAALLDLTELKWYAGFTLSHTWVVAEDGSKRAYHAHAGATAEQIAVTVPGSNSAVWVVSTSEGTGADFVTAYNSAKA